MKKKTKKLVEGLIIKLVQLVAGIFSGLVIFLVAGLLVWLFVGIGLIK